MSLNTGQKMSFNGSGWDKMYLMLVEMMMVCDAVRVGNPPEVDSVTSIHGY